MRFVDINGDKEEHYEEVDEYARQRQENEKHLQEEKQVRAWFAAELDNQSCMRITSGNLMKYVARESRSLKQEFYSLEERIDESLDTEQLWKDFFLYNLNLFAEYFVPKDKRKIFLPVFAEKIIGLKQEVTSEFIHQYQEYNCKYIRYMTECFSLEKSAGQQFWRLLCQIGNTEKYMKEYLRFIYFYVFYLYLSVRTENDFISCKRVMKQYKISLMELIKKQKSKCIVAPDLKKMKNPLYCNDRVEIFQDIQYSMKVILFNLRRKSNDKEGEFEMIEDLYRQIQEQSIVFENLESIVPKEVNQDIWGGKLPEFHDYDAGIIQKNEKVHYLDHTVLYQGKNQEDEIQFCNYKGILIFTDQRIIFKGEQMIDLGYKDIVRVTEYDVVPEILEIRSANKINYFQLPNVEIAYKILKLIANCKKGEKVDNRQVIFSYAELVEKADIKAYIFAFEYMAAGDLPQKLREMLAELNHKLCGLQKTIEKNPQRKEEVYQFLHYYIPEAVSLVQAYQSYQGTGLADRTVDEVYQKVEAAVQTLDGAVYQKILDIYQNSARDTMAGADALKEILGQDGYVDSSYIMNR